MSAVSPRGENDSIDFVLLCMYCVSQVSEKWMRTSAGATSRCCIADICMNIFFSTLAFLTGEVVAHQGVGDTGD